MGVCGLKQTHKRNGVPAGEYGVLREYIECCIRICIINTKSKRYAEISIRSTYGKTGQFCRRILLCVRKMVCAMTMCPEREVLRALCHGMGMLRGTG